MSEWIVWIKPVNNDISPPVTSHHMIVCVIITFWDETDAK